MLDLSKLGRDALQRKEADRVQSLLTPQPATQSGYLAEIDRDRPAGQTHIVQLPNGSRVYGEPSTTGAIGLGDKVGVAQAQGVGAQFLAMPR